MDAQAKPRGADGDVEVMAEMNATPLIDVMLVLLIMLIITIPIQNHAVVLGMQSDISRPTEKRDVVTIDVDFDGTVVWNGIAVPARGSWEARLANIGILPDRAQPEVHLRPNRLAEYKEVAAVMAVAQRVGVTRIGIVGGEQFM